MFEPLAGMVASCLDNPSRASVLDVGCGNGFLQRALEGPFASVTGLDYSQQMLQVNPCKKKCLGSCTSLPFADKSFDVAAAANLFHHLTEPDRIKALEEMRRVARLTVISCEPNRNNPIMFAFATIRPEERMVLSFTSSYRHRLFIKAGLFGVRVRAGGWIVPNKAPVWWIRVGTALGRTPLRRIGFYTYSIGHVNRRSRDSRPLKKSFWRGTC